MKVQTGEYSSYSNNLIDEHGKSKVWLWDLGPEEPMPPQEPIPPAIPATDPKFHLENLRHSRAVKRFEAELLIYERNETEFQQWHRNVRGPVAPPDTSGAHRNAWVTCNEAAAKAGSGASASAAARANLANRIMGGSPGRIADRF